MPSLYRVVEEAARRAAAQLKALRNWIRVEAYPYYKEVHIVIDEKHVISIKVSERRWSTPPSLLEKWSRTLLKHGKRFARRVSPILILSGKPTEGSHRLLADKLRWVKVLPESVL